MDDQTPENKTRKTVSFTHKQIGGVAGVLVALMSIGQLKEIKEFFVGETAATIARIEVQQKEGFDRLERVIKEADAESIVKLRRLKDSTWLELAAVENRCEKRLTELRSDVSSLQIYAFKNRGHGSQN